MAKKYITGDLEITGTLTNNGQPVGGESVVAYDAEVLLPEGVTFSGWSLTRSIKINSVLWLVCCGVAQNSTSSSISINELLYFVLPSDISSHIYRADGTTCNQNYVSNNRVLVACGGREDSTQRFILLCEAPNKLKLTFGQGQYISANSSMRIDIRIPIFLDIGSIE